MSELGLFYDMDDGEYAPLLELDADDPASAARTLRKHMSPDDLRTLARLLLEEEDV